MKSGACWLMLGLVQPLYTIVAWAVTGAHLLLLAVRCAWHIRNSRVEEAHPILGWEEWTEAARRAIWAVTISSPPVLYTLVASTLDPFFKAWTAQNLILSPHPLHYLLAYGLPVAAILAGLPYLRRVFYEGAQSGPYTGQAARPDLLAVWLLALPFLVYAPYPLQRRLAEGAWVALIALALTALQGRSIRLAGLPLLLLFPSTLLLWTGGLAGAGKPSQPLFRPTAETAAFEFVASSLELGAVVLASYDTANALPAWAPVQVIVGHGPESPGYTGLRLRLERFFQAATPDVERRAMLQEFQIQAVYWGPTERILGGWDPRSASYLRLIYDEDGYSIFTPVKSDEN